MRSTVSICLVSVLLSAAACGESKPTESTASAVTPAPAAPANPPPVVHDGRPIEITSSDTIKYSVTEIRAKAGERLTVSVTNAGTMPKFSMGHNWVLLIAGVDAEAFGVAAAEAATTDYVPSARRAEVIAATKLLGPGEKDTVTFNAPTAPGSYTFLCTFPGHLQAGMRGVLIVQ